MQLDDIKISEAIIERYMKKLIASLDVDVAIAGAGPSGLTAAFYLAKKHKKVALFERHLSVGGGMWGGGMMFNEIVVQEEGRKILQEFDVDTKKWQQGYYTASSVETVSSLTRAAVKAGTQIFNLISVEDVMLQKGRVTGLVLNWSATQIANLHVDPLTIRSKYVIEATGHPTEVLKVIERKSGKKLSTPSGGIEGERSMWADVGEKSLIKNTKEVFPGVWVTGMAANAAYGSPRMGPIFGGMLLSGKYCAEQILKQLK
ncbi:MAG: sulfide-dependent adenosine diphosphate thiazole synthase [bacterium]|nr:sulfide-dependent adenosine diphosphate thiazole synthase [bacterium]